MKQCGRSTPALVWLAQASFMTMGPAGVVIRQGEEPEGSESPRSTTSL